MITCTSETLTEQWVFKFAVGLCCVIKLFKYLYFFIQCAHKANLSLFACVIFQVLKNTSFFNLKRVRKSATNIFFSFMFSAILPISKSTK